MTTRIQIRRGTAAQWMIADPVLAAGEQGLDTDTNRVKIGDGTTAWTGLAYTDHQSSVLAALRFDPASDMYGAVRDDASAATANTAAIQLAADDARIAGGTLVIKGTYYVDSTINVQSHMDGSAGKLITTNATVDPLIRVGNPTSGAWIADLQVVVPSLVQEAKVGIGWAASGTGVEFVNLNSCHITTRRITNFTTNMRLAALGTGCVYNDFTLGWLENGKVNLHLDAPVSAVDGWIQENVFINGRFHHNGGEGTNVAGTRHILIDPLVGNNLFLKPSIEGNTAEFHIDCGGSYNQFNNARYEAAPPRVRFTADSHSNQVMYGYGAHSIVLTDAGTNNHTMNRNGMRINGSGHGVFTGYGGGLTSGVFVAVNAVTANPETEYGASIGPRYARFKATTNAFPRVEIDGANGSVAWGNGTVAPANTLTAFGTVGIQASSYFRVGTVASLPTASSSYRRMQIWVEGGAGVADELYVCRKTAADTYAWVKVTP